MQHPFVNWIDVQLRLIDKLWSVDDEFKKRTLSLLFIIAVFFGIFVLSMVTVEVIFMAGINPEMLYAGAGGFNP